jgi:hypothetical protein
VTNLQIKVNTAQNFDAYSISVGLEIEYYEKTGKKWENVQSIDGKYLLI